MKGEERRMMIIQTLRSSGHAVSGKTCASLFVVRRLVVVQDFALLRAEGHEIVSTNHGYLLSEHFKESRVFKVYHTMAETETELNLIVDYGAVCKDVFVYHKVYGLIHADLNIRSRADVAAYLQSIRTGKSQPLMNLTSGYHYHTVLAESSEVLDTIQNKLMDAGFLAPLTDYEPVDFWGAG